MSGRWGGLDRPPATQTWGAQSGAERERGREGGRQTDTERQRQRQSEMQRAKEAERRACVCCPTADDLDQPQAHSGVSPRAEGGERVDPQLERDVVRAE